MSVVATADLRGGWAGAVIDADLHVNVPSIDVLRPYLAPQWVEFIAETGFAGPPWMNNIYPPGLETTTAPQWRRDDGRPSASSYQELRAQLLDPLDPEVAIVNCAWGVEAVRQPDFATALAAAVNDWLVAEFLDRDPRLRASLVVPAFVPAEAAAEIDRVGGHPGFVSVFLPSRSSRPYGQRSWYPMFEAIARHDLVAAIHLGGFSDAPGPTGLESWFIEEHVAGHVGTIQAQLTSILSEGLLQKFPTLRFSFLESGFAWLAPTVWRLDREWQALRRDVPWLTEPPGNLIRERIRFSGQPIDAGPPRHFAKAVEWIGAEELLMFASDYPHGHANSVATLFDAIGDDGHAALMAGNARAHYQL
jgi:predicted TIM-barrel fold metal-dependent hydrolase